MNPSSRSFPSYSRTVSERRRPIKEGDVATSQGILGSHAELAALVDGLDLDEQKKTYLRVRWLGQMNWFASNARKDQLRFYRFRLVGIIAGLIVPALVLLNTHHAAAATVLAWLTFSVSLLGSISIAVESFFNYGGRWKQYRRTSELLKSQGWQFLELTGSYQRFHTHLSAFHHFSVTVEALISEDVEDYLTTVMRDQNKTETSAPSTTPAPASTPPHRG